MSKQRTIEEIDREINEQNSLLDKVEGTSCEVYSRITGYYRPVKNWNPAKAQEYKERKMFKVDIDRINEML